MLQRRTARLQTVRVESTVQEGCEKLLLDGAITCRVPQMYGCLLVVAFKIRAASRSRNPHYDPDDRWSPHPRSMAPMSQAW